MTLDWTLITVSIVAALVAGGFATVVLTYFERRSKSGPVSIFADQSANTVFLFDGETLVCERIYFDVLSMLRQLLDGAPPALLQIALAGLMAAPATTPV